MEVIVVGVGVVLVGLVLAVLAVAWILRSPFLWGQFQDVIADMNRENQELRSELAANDRAIRDLRRELQRAERKIDRLEQYAEDATMHNELLAARLRALGQLDIPPAPEPPPREEPPPAAPSPAALTDTSQRIVASFSIEEIDDLAMELGLSEVIAGDSQEQRASSLALAALRRGLLEELRSIARRKRPRGGF